MKKILVLILVSFVLFNPCSFAFLDGTPHQFTLGANYGLNSQNMFGDFPVLSLNLNLSPSLIINETHEIGLNLSYNGTKSTNTITNTSTSTSTTNIGPYYRYNVSLTGPDAKVPVLLYFGPQFGLSTISLPGATGTTTSTTNLSAGAQIGFNFMFTKNLALNFHAFQFDTVFATLTQLIMTQSLGIRYYFQ